MIITISGTPGAGDTTTTEMLAEEINYEVMEVGEIYKEIAKEKGINTEKLWEEQEKNNEKLKEFHRELDKKQKKTAEEKENLIINGKLSAFHVDADLKIFLDADIEERARRIYMREKVGRKKYAESVEKGQRANELDKEEIKKKIEEIRSRQRKETKHWEKIYGFNYIEDREIYDLVIDTTDEKPSETAEAIAKRVRDTDE